MTLVLIMVLVAAGGLWLATGSAPPGGGAAVPNCTRTGGTTTVLASGSWCHRAIGEEGRRDPLLVLVGGLGVPAAVPQALVPLAGDRPIWAVAHPPVGSVDRAVAGIGEFLDAHALERVHLLGSSVGGALVQAVVRAEPDRVRSIILANTAPPLGTGVVRSVWRGLRRPLARVPTRVLEGWTRRRLTRAVADGLPEEVRRNDLASGLTAAHLFALVDLLADFHVRTYSTEDLDGWSGRILILESDDDPMVTPRHRQRLRQLYPAAEVRTFSAAGHLPALTRPAEFGETIRAFLAGAS